MWRHDDVVSFALERSECKPPPLLSNPRWEGEGESPLQWVSYDLHDYFCVMGLGMRVLPWDNRRRACFGCES